MKRVKYKDPDLVQVFLGFSKHVKKLQTTNTKTLINKFSELVKPCGFNVSKQ